MAARASGAARPRLRRRGRSSACGRPRVSCSMLNSTWRGLMKNLLASLGGVALALVGHRALRDLRVARIELGISAEPRVGFRVERQDRVGQALVLQPARRLAE